MMTRRSLCRVRKTDAQKGPRLIMQTKVCVLIKSEENEIALNSNRFFVDHIICLSIVCIDSFFMLIAEQIVPEKMM